MCVIFLEEGGEFGQEAQMSLMTRVQMCQYMPNFTVLLLTPSPLRS